MIASEKGEQVLIKALEDEKIQTWEHFEYILSFIVENRFLRIYQAYLESKYKIQDIPEIVSSDEKK